MKKMRTILMTIVILITMTISGLGQTYSVNKDSTLIVNLTDTIGVFSVVGNTGLDVEFNLKIDTNKYGYILSVKTWIDTISFGDEKIYAGKSLDTNYHFTFSDIGIYELIIVNQLQPSGTYEKDTLTIHITDTTTDTTSVNFPITDNIKVKVYPNPVTDYLTVEIDTYKDELIRLYDASGRLLKETYETKLDFTSYPKGLYLVNVRDRMYKVLK